MQEFDAIGEDLFNKIRGRFPEVTIGDETGTVTNEPTMARFFDFDYNGLGKVSVAIDEDEGLTVIYAKDFMEDQDEMTKEAWYDFLKELRVFSKKRMLNYSVRDITKSNLTKRDYKFLAKTPEDGQMTESKLYGTSRISYQKVGEARIVIKHTEGVNQESATGRTQKIGKIYIESADGERFRYPFKHLSGARAMARHVAEGGNTYDDFGKHIVGLSEEMSKLRKFKNYMGRSAVMAESLAGYVDVVKERIATVKKTITNLQKPAYYAETFAAFETPMMEDVPADVKENWIDQLTIKQFNEELSDVFPYIYNLVSEATKATELGPEELVDEASKGIEAMKKAGNAKADAEAKERAKKDKSVEEGPFKGVGKTLMKRKLDKQYKKSDLANFDKSGIDTSGKTPDEIGDMKSDYYHSHMDKADRAKKAKNRLSREEIALEQGFEEMMGQFAETKDEVEVQEAYINTSKDAVDVLGALRGKGKAIERGQDDDQGNLANQYATDVWDVYSFIEARTKGFSGLDKNAKAAIDDMMKLRGEAKKLETEPGSGLNARFGNAIVTVLYPVMEYLNTTDFDRNKKEDEAVEPEKQKTPLGEFILSYFDRENGQFPKGETAVLTMVEKDYGEQFIEPAKAFIEQIQAKFDEWQMRSQPQQMEASGPCHHCSGSGHEMGNPGKACLDCGGSGKSTEKNEDAIDENFTQAAAAAARAHKTEFEYPKGSGKMHPVKMSKGTAHEINDDYDRIRELAGLR
jgi:hypothetical protein